MLRALIPGRLKSQYRRLQRRLEQSRNRSRSAEDVFSVIYANNGWGGKPGEFCSGTGSQDPAITDPYVAAITSLAHSERFSGKVFVDLGCGDFAVGRRLLPLASRYVGVDVVRTLIEHNQLRFGTDTARFVHLDITADELPAGDVCFVRQVFQHLSNQQIRSVLGKLERYAWVVITEHYPTDNPSIVRNKDKVHGGDVRVLDNSGVWFCDPPFSLPRHAVTEVLEVPGSPVGPRYDRGVIRTFLYKPAPDSRARAS
jgi:predicted RNA methylase